MKFPCFSSAILYLTHSRGESHIYFRTQRVIMTLAGWRTITNDVLKFRKIIEFQSLWIVMNCQWIVYLFNHRCEKIIWYFKKLVKYCEINQLLQLWVRILRSQFVSCYNPYMLVNSQKKISLLQSLAPKKLKRQQQQ